MRSSHRQTSVIAVLLLLTSAAWAQNTKYQAKDAGEVQIKYGTPTWRPDLLNKASPGSYWRLGAGSATLLETAGAIVSKEGIVFPGSYNLALRLGQPHDWALLFHRGGSFYREGKRFGEFDLKKSEITEKEPIAERLQIDLEAPKDKALKAAGAAAFRIRFGPHRLDTTWTIVGVGKSKAKLGKDSVTIETAKLPANEEYQKLLDGKAEGPFPVARLTPEGDKAPSYLLLLVPGETPVLRVEDLGRDLQGTRAAAPASVPALKGSVDQGNFKLHLGPTLLTFALDPNLLKRVETGASTPGRSGN